MQSRTRATQAELARILGVSPNTVSNAKSLDSFPEARDNTYEIRAVVVWWHKQKDGGCEPDGLVDLRSEREHLELQLKDAEVQLKLRELVRVGDIRADLQRFAAKLSDALESIEQSTGQPIDGVIEPVFAEFLQSLDKRVNIA